MTTMPPKLPGASSPDIRVSGRSSPLGFRLFLSDVLLYLVTFLGVLTAHHVAVIGMWLVLNGVVVGRLFVLAHDACHGSLTGSAHWNGVLGRIGFLPSWNPYTAWKWAHNGVHHGWTNCRAHDFVWAPLTRAEYDRLPPLQKRLQRVYRTEIGVGLYYLIEIWIRRLMFPDRRWRTKFKSVRAFRFEQGSILVFVLCQFVLVFTFARSQDDSVIYALIKSGCAVTVPFLLWNWIIGWATFTQHNHPSVVWYPDEQAWSYHTAQIEGTVHLDMPWYLTWIGHDVMKHTAHHVDPRLPVYHLPEAQQQLERMPEHHVVCEKWSLLTFSRTLRTCQLYDLDRRCWLTFSGDMSAASVGSRDR